MNINDDKQQQLIDHAAFILAISDEPNPPPIRWEEIKLALKEHSIALTNFIIPKIKVEPRYSSANSNGINIATFEPRALSDNEVHPEESSVGEPHFLVPVRPDKE